MRAIRVFAVFHCAAVIVALLFLAAFPRHFPRHAPLREAHLALLPGRQILRRCEQT